MGKKIATYLLGVAMGIILMLLFNTLIFDMNSNEKELLDLKETYENLMQEKNKLEAELDTKIKSEDSIEDSQKNTIEINISQNESHEKIANKLVDEGVYSHKNDIMFILEILEYDKLEAEKYLVDYGVVPKHTNALKLYDEKSLRIREILSKEKIIEDEDSFEKFQYIIDRSTRIIPGNKIFKRNSSLREIIDILSN